MKSIQDKLEEVVDEVVHAPIVEKKKRTRKTPVAEPEPMKETESQSVEPVDDSPKYHTPISKRHHGYPKINFKN